jgi:hypothetical protein
MANQASTEALTQNLSSTITQTESSINQTLTQIDCSLSSGMEGFGFTPPNSSSSGFTPGQYGSGSFTSGQFGGGMRPGEFGGGAFSIGGTTPMNESLYDDISSIDGVAAEAPYLQVSEGHNQTITAPNGGSFTRLMTEYRY